MLALTIKEMRNLSGMTQKNFSEYFGIPMRTIQDWENNRRQCPDYTLDLIQYKLEKENIIKTNRYK